MGDWVWEVELVVRRLDAKMVTVCGWLSVWLEGWMPKWVQLVKLIVRKLDAKMGGWVWEVELMVRRMNGFVNNGEIYRQKYLFVFYCLLTQF